MRVILQLSRSRAMKPPAPRWRLAFPVKCDVVRRSSFMCRLNPTTSQHQRSLSLHLMYSDMIFTYLWILFDCYYRPVRRRKALEKAAALISFERLNHVRVTTQRGDLLDFPV